MDAIQLILRDHRNIEHLFKEFARAERNNDGAGQEESLRDLVRELSIHAAMEEQFVYPGLREWAGQEGVLTAIEEHHLVKLTLAELAGMAPGPRRAVKVRVLETNVRRHVEEEEKDLLPKMEAKLDVEGRRELGEELERARRVAPTRPHPAAPETPPANLLVGAYAAMYDRSRDAMRGGAEMVGAIAAQGARAGLDAAKVLAARARRLGGERVNGTLGKGRGVIDEAVGRGRAAVKDVMEKGREAIAEASAGAREAAARLEVRGDQASKAIRQGARAAAEDVGGHRARARKSRSRSRARASRP